MSSKGAAASEGVANGLDKGHKVTKIPQKQRPSRRKGYLSKKVKLVREVIRDVVGLMPYEKRILDVLKTGGTGSEKRVYKFAKRRLGTHRRALRKREEIKELWSRQRARQG